MKLMDFQEKAVRELTKQARNLLVSEGSDKALIFKSPTGSGKTVMMGEFLRRLAQESADLNVAFLWLSLYDLHDQSFQKLQGQLSDTSYRLLMLESLDSGPLANNTIVFANWHSLTTTKKHESSSVREWSNVYVRDGETNKNIRDILTQTREQGKQVVLIVDEAHRNYLTDNSQRFISEVVSPSLTIEVSATPLMTASAEEIQNRKKGFYGVAFSDVVSSGLIKKEVVINEGLGGLDSVMTTDEAVLHSALRKRKELSDHFSAMGVAVNPLLLIQLPSELKDSSALDQTIREWVESELEKLGITYENGKLAVWLSGEVRNRDGIENNSSPVEALIFKEAVAVGWDCPRAQLLVMMRSIKSVIFEIQTIGRILRTPEARHYGEPDVDRGYIFTNIEDVSINRSPEDLEFFKVRASQASDAALASPIQLESDFVRRVDYGDLTASFSGLLVEELNRAAGFEATDSSEVLLKKADQLLEIEMSELTRPVLSDFRVENVDRLMEEIGPAPKIHSRFKVSENTFQAEFDYLMKAWSLPYAPIRSFGKIKSGIYRWFAQFGFDSDQWDMIQRIVTCSLANQTVFKSAVESARARFDEIRLTEISSKNNLLRRTVQIPLTQTYGESFEEVPASKYALEPCYLRKDRSEPERQFEQLVDGDEGVDYWYKNGEGQQEHFSVPYRTREFETGVEKMRNFYPDYLVLFKDGTIGIFETKSGMSLSDPATNDKWRGLYKFWTEWRGSQQIIVGLISRHKGSLQLTTLLDFAGSQSAWTPLTKDFSKTLLG